MERLRASQICEQLRSLVCDQLDLIHDRDDLNSDYVSSLSDNFESIKDTAQFMVGKLKKLENDLAPKFDFDETCRANGFWSLVRVCKICCMRLMELVNHVTSYHYQSTLLKTKNPMKDLQAFTQSLAALDKALDFIVANERHFLDSNNLIISFENHSQELLEKLYDHFEELPRAPFYGRAIGFHYEPSLINPLLAIVVSELSYAELYESTGFARKATAFLSGGKFYLNNKLRGYCMDSLSRFCDMSFGKSFWSLTELNMVQHVPSLVCNSVEVNRVLELERQSIVLIPPGNQPGEPIEVPYPHLIDSKSDSPFFMRLISYLTREGMIPNDVSVVPVVSQSATQLATATVKDPLGAWVSAVSNPTQPTITPVSAKQSRKKNLAPPADAIIIHVHGGGFVSQSSKSHEIYLRSWAKFLNVPIVAIDYSLAPEHPFPTAVDECFYCYCWIVNNLEKLGCKKNAKICIVGDSAGGNLALAIALRCVQTRIHKPDGIVAIYPAVYPQYALSPSRVLSIMDCLLAVGILDQCLLAYLGEQDPLPPFKLSKVLEHYQGEWEYSLTEPSSGSSTGLAMLPTLACGSWLYRLVRKPNSETGLRTRSRRGTLSGISKNESETLEETPESDALRDYKLEMIENSDWIAISRCSSDSSPRQSIETAEAVKIIAGDSDDEKEPDYLPDTQSYVLVDQPKDSQDCSQSQMSTKEPGMYSKAGAARKNIGSFRLMSRFHRNKAANTGSVNDPESVSPRNSHLQFLNTPNSDAIARGLIKSSSLPSLDTQQVLGESQDGSSGAKESRSHNWGKLEEHFVSPVAAVSVDGSTDSNSKASRPRSGANQASNSDAKSQQFALFQEEMKQWRAKKKRAILNTIKSSHVKNPLHCPLIASDEELKGLPPVHILVGAMDPLLDESVCFAKRLKGLNKPITFDVLESLPHGFLNFVLVSKLCRDASDLCQKRISEVISHTGTAAASCNAAVGGVHAGDVPKAASTAAFSMETAV